MTRVQHPHGTYVALYGSHGTAWRRRAAAILDRNGVPWHDPSDERWSAISHENGDAHQALIDELVEEEHTALLGAGCALFHLDGGDDPPASLAARVELGLLAGRRLPTYVHVDPRALGRNYVWATLRLYPHLHRCDTLEEAAERAAEHLASSG